MDASKKFNNPNPQPRANPLSKLFFWWLMPFLSYGYKYDLKMKDIYNVREEDMSERVTDEFERNWNKVCEEAKRKNIRPSLTIAIRNTFMLRYILIASIELLRVIAMTYAMPAALDALISYFSEVPRDPEKGWYLGGIVVGVVFICAIFTHHTGLYKKVIGMRIRVACGALIYRKILRLNRTSLNEVDVGQVVNLLSNDLSRFDIVAEVFSNIWLMPFVAVIGTYVMFDKSGLIAFVGIGAMLLQAIPFQGYLSKLLGQYRFKIAQRTDIRVKLMNELITGIQVIKMYAWEKPFEELVEWLRGKEVDAITRTTYIKSISVSIQVFTERVTLYIIVVGYVLLGHQPTGGMVFSISQLINILQLNVCILFAMALNACAEAKTSIYRLEEFLIKEERKPEEIHQALDTPTGLVKLSNVHASWSPESSGLVDVSFELPPGSLCCIIGNVGSGKSTILNLLLRELPLKCGSLDIGGRVSYASQEPWLFVSNIRNNILFGQPSLKDKYKKVVQACCLERDFDLFMFGDKTSVGEKGVSLSGGQRARINLARAVYRDADIYLLDDPLSAVDPHVAKQLMADCVGGYLKNKTRILVTHQTQFIDQADFVLVLNDGKVEKFFKPNEISQKDFNFIRQISTIETQAPVVAPKASQEIFHSLLSLKSDGSLESETAEDEPQENQELIEKGAMSFDVYKDYYKTGATTSFLIFEILLVLIAQAFCNSCDLWVTFWINNIAEEAKMTNIYSTTTAPFNFTENSMNVTLSEVNENIATKAMALFEKYIASFNPFQLTEYAYIIIYTLVIITAVVLTISRSAVFFRICMKASKKLHNMMFSNILQARMRFFDTNPSGRILNRFSKDIGAVDEILPEITLMTIQSICVGGGILVMIFIKSYYMIVPAVILGLFINWFRKIFFKATQDVKRLEGTAKAPVFSYVAASLDGLPTIRCANAEEMVKREFDVLQDEHSATYFLFIYAFRAFALYLDMMSMIFLGVIITNFLLDTTALSGNVGLVISQSLIVVNMIQMSTRNITEVQNNMTSVERVLQYLKLDKEGPFRSEKRLPKNWPEAGRLTFKNLYLRYVPDEEPVLKNLNLEIEPGEKIGIVGRTGAGKSTLISALFRLAFTEGTIQIDGVDTETVGLRDLRSRISIIPQEPTLFSESIRFNLDPFGTSGDSDLWKALDAVELKSTIPKLDMKVTEGGSNFSAGQRQLICLARAIIRNNRILVMDEATANVDQHTDSLIQKTIRENFKRCTVLTVAHRLNTIIDCDRVIVMDAGEMKEFGAPHELLQNRDGYFTIMVEKTGPTMEKKLRRIAEEHFKNKQN